MKFSKLVNISITNAVPLSHQQNVIGKGKKSTRDLRT